VDFCWLNGSNTVSLLLWSNNA